MDVKGAGDYVTAFDRRSEAAILEVLAREAQEARLNKEMQTDIVQQIVRRLQADPKNVATLFDQAHAASMASSGVECHTTYDTPPVRY